MNLRRLPIIQLGLGQVGRALVRQVQANHSRHAAQLGIHLEYIAIADHDGVIIQQAGLSDEKLTRLLQGKEQGINLRNSDGGHPWSGQTTLLEAYDGQQAIVVDVTASKETIPALREARRQGLGIVLANKLPLAGSYDLFRELTASRRTRYETTVGAALPVIAPLQILLDTGDTVRRIRGALSGTLNFICQRLAHGKRLSEVVREARRQGYTEPDPREDLGGRDVARKALILARLLGHPLELCDIKIERLYPPEMDALSIEDFMNGLPTLDELYAKKAREAQQNDRSLRYVIDVGESRCEVGLRQLPLNDELIRHQPADSVVAFETRRYGESALLVTGRGAGAELTASGVLGDILALAQST